MRASRFDRFMVRVWHRLPLLVIVAGGAGYVFGSWFYGGLR